MSMSPSPIVSVLIVGAGPTGLVLALWLTRLGVRVRIVDKTSEPGTTSRALAVQARTLELYNQIGLADAVVQRGRKVERRQCLGGRHAKAHAVFGEIGAGLSPFPYALMYSRRTSTNGCLIDRLAALASWSNVIPSSSAFDEVADRVRGAPRGPAGAEESCEAAYLAGCDGAHSTVREHAGDWIPGRHLRASFLRGRRRGTGPTMNSELHVALDDADFLAVFPLKGEGRARLIGTVREGVRAARQDLSWNDVSKRRASNGCSIEVER